MKCIPIEEEIETIKLEHDNYAPKLSERVIVKKVMELK
jgi:hypothetical protein